MKFVSIMAVITAVSMLTVASPAEARKGHMNKAVATKDLSSVVTQYCGDRVCEIPTSGTTRSASVRGNGNKNKNVRTDANGNEAYVQIDSSTPEHVTTRRGREVWDRISIPTPAGTWRVARSCGERLAKYWDLGPGLDATVTWLRAFPRASQPAPRVAVYTPGHIMGVVGGREGAWRVVSFNGDGRHGNVEFTISSLRGYTLLDTTTRRTASESSGQRRRAARHKLPTRVASHRAGGA